MKTSSVFLVLFLVFSSFLHASASQNIEDKQLVSHADVLFNDGSKMRYICQIIFVPNESEIDCIEKQLKNQIKEAIGTELKTFEFKVLLYNSRAEADTAIVNLYNTLAPDAVRWIKADILPSSEAAICN